jgi:hypothetical protein
MIQLTCQQETAEKGTAMNWHRDGKGGYKAESDSHDAHATIERVNPYSLNGKGKTVRWEVVTFVFGRELDRAIFEKIADAKWHAQSVISVACVGPQG